MRLGGTGGNGVETLIVLGRWDEAAALNEVMEDKASAACASAASAATNSPRRMASRAVLMVSLSKKTASVHVSNILRKLDARDRWHAGDIGRQAGLGSAAM